MAGGSLQLESVSRAMAGLYTCEATNSRGEARAETEEHQHSFTDSSTIYRMGMSYYSFLYVSESKRVSFQ